MHRDLVTLVRDHCGRMDNHYCRHAGQFDKSEELSHGKFVKVFRGSRTCRVESGTLVGWTLRVGPNPIIVRYRQSKIERS